MKTVGLRELKNRLGVYVQHVRKGETVIVTDRGKPVAELSPPRETQHGGIPPALLEMARRGEVTLAKPMSKKERAALYRIPPGSRPVLEGTTVQELLDAVREDRF
jgi:prevent-host-death family protein